MGGSTGLTIREPDGTEHRMCRWTTMLPWAINNMRLINKDPEHIRAVLQEWKEMRADYERNKWNGKFKNNRTECYAPYPFLAPQEYGLVVVDMANEEILDYQGFKSAGSMHAAGILLDMFQLESRKKNPWGANDDYDHVRFKEFYEAGRILEATRLSKNLEHINVKGKSLQELIEMMKKNRESLLEFELDMSPFKVTRYKECDPEDAQLLKLKLKELGFELSDEEKRIWAEWIKEKYE